MSYRFLILAFRIRSKKLSRHVSEPVQDLRNNGGLTRENSMTTPRQPGWYDDPNDANAQRYWDGQGWTPHRQRKSASRPAQPPTVATPPQQPPPAPNLPPPPPPPPSNSPPSQEPAASRVKFGVSKVWLVLTGLALVLVIAGLVAGRVALGTFLPGILVVAVVAIVGAVVTFRSRQSRLRKAVVVSVMALVVAVAVPASLKVVYPVYSHFFEQKSAQASRAGTAGSGPMAQAPGSQAGGGAAGSGPAPQAPGAPGAPSPGGVKSGILTMTNDISKGRTYGFIDPSSGKYSEVASFSDPWTPGEDIRMDIAVSPDFTKLAVNGVDSQPGIGWIDTSGKFTNVTPKVDTGPFGGSPPDFGAIGFDGAGNFFYYKTSSTGIEAYKLAPGSTTNAQKVGALESYLSGSLNYDGSMQLGCSGVHWLGPNNVALAPLGTQIAKAPSTRDEDGCPTPGNDQTDLLPKTNNVKVGEPVGNHDGTKIAFKYFGGQSGASLYIVAADGNSQPTKVNLPSLTGDQLSAMSFLRWI